LPNKNYEKGRRKEYKVMHSLRNEGYIAFRSAGSHSPIDVVGIRGSDNKIKLVQCKPDSMSENAKNKLYEANKALNGTFEVEFKVI